MKTSEALLPTPSVGGNYNRKGASKKSGDGLSTKLTSLRAASPASPSLKLDEEKERQTTVFYGQKCYELYESFIRGGLSVKTLAASLLGTKVWYSNKCILIWKVKVTKSKRLLFQLSPSMRRTDVTESGLLATPNTLDSMAPKTDKAVEREATVTRKGRTKMANLRDQLYHGMMLPTPNTNQRGTRSDEGFKKRHQKELQDVIVRMLPTPRSSGRGGTEKGRDSVDSVIEMNATKGQIGQKTGLRLQPDFAGWMMGYPMGYLDLEDGEMPRSKRTEML